MSDDEDDDEDEDEEDEEEVSIVATKMMFFPRPSFLCDSHFPVLDGWRGGGSRIR